MPNLYRRINQLLQYGLSFYGRRDSSKDDVDPPRSSEISVTEPREARMILTLLGNSDRGPKQLFSSLQRPRNASDDTTIYPEVDEAALPNGISATKILPYNTAVSEKSPIVGTKFGDVFKLPKSVKVLDPPKQSRNLTRGSNLTWGQDPETVPFSRNAVGDRERVPEKEKQLPSGQWIHFTDCAPSSLQSSPEEKRRQRDRALSFSDAKSDLRGGERYNQQVARDKALFQSAYSSFAPTVDTADTVVPEQMKNQVWWNRFGRRRFNYVSSRYPDHGLSGQEDVPTFEEIQETAKGFAEAVATFTPESPPRELATSSEKAERETEDLLSEISDLLSTLGSHQRNRNLSTLSPSRPSMSELSKMTGSPSTPSSAEFDIYEMLRLQLSAIISSLPPHIVARLDGDQLQSLNVCSRILLDNTDFTGTMEKDDFTKQKEQALRAVNPTTTRTNSPATATPRANYQALNAAMYNAKGYSSTTRSASTAGYQPHNSYRQPNQYTSLAASYPNRPSSNTQRPNYASYGQSITSQHSQSPSVHQFQRPTPNGYGTAYGTQQPPPYQRQQQQQPLQRSSSGTYPYGTSPSKSATDSPMYPLRNSQNQPQYLQQVPQSANYGNETPSKASFPVSKAAPGPPQTPSAPIEGFAKRVVDGADQASSPPATINGA